MFTTLLVFKKMHLCINVCEFLCLRVCVYIVCVPYVWGDQMRAQEPLEHVKDTLVIMWVPETKAVGPALVSTLVSRAISPTPEPLLGFYLNCENRDWQ